MVTCGESWGHLGKIEGKFFMGSDRVLSVGQKWDFEKMENEICSDSMKSTLCDLKTSKYTFVSLKVN